MFERYVLLPLQCIRCDELWKGNAKSATRSEDGQVEFWRQSENSARSSAKSHRDSSSATQSSASLLQIESLVHKEKQVDGGSVATISVPAPLLDLHVPSQMAAKRKIRLNPPIGQRKPKKVIKKNDNLAQKRIREYPGQFFQNKNGILYCDACHEELNVEASTIKRHLDSERHQKAVKARNTRVAQNLRLSKSIDDWFQLTNAQGATLTETTNLYRLKLLSTFLLVGIPINRTDVVGDFLDEYAQGSITRPVLSQLDKLTALRTRTSGTTLVPRTRSPM